MRALLDVCIVALLDVGHVHHVLATSWLEREICYGWASCPKTVAYALCRSRNTPVA